MTDSTDGLKSAADRLRQERDELRVQLDLARMEARDQWNALEKKWDQFQGRLRVVGEEAEDVGGEAVAAAGLLADELKEGYRRLRDLL